MFNTCCIFHPYMYNVCLLICLDACSLATRLLKYEMNVRVCVKLILYILLEIACMRECKDKIVMFSTLYMQLFYIPTPFYV